MDYLALKNEFITDPKSYGYSEFWSNGQDWKLAELINQVRDSIQINRDIVSSYQIFEAMVPEEWAALSVQEKQRIQIILSMGEISTKGVNTRAAFQAAFAAGTVTRTNLITLLTRKGSRAEELFGAGISVSWDDVARSRRI
jgi:hypothetical protein